MNCRKTKKIKGVKKSSFVIKFWNDIINIHVQ